MIRRPAPAPAAPAAPAAALAVALAVLALPAAAQIIAPAPVPGPVGLSVGNESRMALFRAERWLALHDSAPAPDEAPGEAPDDDLLPDDDPAPLLPLLQGDRSVLSPDTNPYEARERLARALARRGEPYVFLSDGTPLPWRNALLHDLVTAQRLDARGAGWWTDRPDLPPDDPASDAVPSTRAACRTLLFLSGVPAP